MNSHASKFCFLKSNKSFSNNRSSSLCVEYISTLYFSRLDFINLLKNLLLLSTHILFGLWFDLSKASTIAITFLLSYKVFK